MKKNNPHVERSKLHFASRRPNQAFYGAPVGILLLDRTSSNDAFDCPFIPGSVGSASTWSVPGRYKTVPASPSPSLLRPRPTTQWR